MMTPWTWQMERHNIEFEYLTTCAVADLFPRGWLITTCIRLLARGQRWLALRQLPPEPGRMVKFGITPFTYEADVMFVRVSGLRVSSNASFAAIGGDGSMAAIQDEDGHVD